VKRKNAPIGEVYKPHPNPLLGKERGTTRSLGRCNIGLGTIIIKNMTDKELFNLMKVTGERVTLTPGKKEALKSSLFASLDAQRENTVLPKISFWVKMADAFVPANLALRPVASFSLVMGLFLITSFATVNASKNSLPGNPLYSVKVGSERLRYFLTFSDEARAKVSLEMARKRAEELKQVMNNGLASNETFTSIIVSEQLAGELNNVKEKLNKMRSEEKDLNKVVAMAKEVEKQVAVIEEKLNQEENVAVKDNLKKVFVKTEEVKFVVLATLVNQYDENGGTAVEKDELTAAVEKKIEALTVAIKELLKEEAEKITVLNENLTAAKTAFKDGKLSETLEIIEKANNILNGNAGTVEGATTAVEESESLAIVPQATTTSTTIVNNAAPALEWKLESEKQGPVVEFEMEVGQ
jgi:hypothetical protein